MADLTPEQEKAPAATTNPLGDLDFRLAYRLGRAGVRRSFGEPWLPSSAWTDERKAQWSAGYDRGVMDRSACIAAEIEEAGRGS